MKKFIILFYLLSMTTALNVIAQDSTSADSVTTILGAGKALETLKNTQPEWSITFGKIFWALIVFLIGLVAIKYSARLLERIGERWTNLRLTIKGVVPVVRISGWTIVIYFIIAYIFEPPIETLVALTASAGIAIGFASQDILKNIFGGIMILFDRPFQVGDKIEVGNYYGEVISIGLRTVRIVTKDDSLVAIPNSEIVNQSVSNSNSGESNCQVVAEFYLPADINIKEARKLAYKAAAVSRYIYLKKPIVVVFKNEINQGRSMLKLRLKAYVLDIRYEFAFASEMTETVMREFLKNKLVESSQLAFIN